MIKDIAYFAKVKENAVIPSKREEDGAYDLYACFSEDNFVIEPQECRLVPTGIASVFKSEYAAILRERGSTGLKNLKLNAGVIDSGYRNEWFVMIYNGNTKPIVITKENDTEALEEDYIVYPYNKAIAQFLFIPVPKIAILEKSYDEIKQIESERGLGHLGSSGK